MGKKKKKYKLIIAGSRTINDMKVLEKALAYNKIDLETVSEIVCDDSYGTSKHACWLADKHKIKKKIFPIDWSNLTDEPVFIKENQHGKYNAAAPFVTANKIVDYGDALLLVVTVDGSTVCDKILELAKEQNKPIHIYEV